MFNPLTIATCLARPTSVFANAAILQAVATAVTGNIIGTIYSFALAAYMSGYLILLAPPIALLAYDCSVSRAKQAQQPTALFVQFGVGLGIGIASLLILSWFLMDSWRFLASTYGIQLTLTDLTPNIGLWWYFFIEMFDSFRTFFLGVFWLHMSSYVGALTIRIRYVLESLTCYIHTNALPLASNHFL